MIPKSGTKFEEKLIFCFKSDKNLLNFDPSTKKPKKFTLWLVLWHFEELCLIALEIDTKFEAKLACVSKNWHEEFGKFSPEHLKVSKLGPWWHTFISSWKCMSLTITGELCVMTIKNDAKIDEELTCQFKIDMRNLTNFDQSTWKSQKFAL